MRVGKHNLGRTACLLLILLLTLQDGFFALIHTCSYSDCPNVCRLFRPEGVGTSDLLEEAVACGYTAPGPPPSKGCPLHLWAKNPAHGRDLVWIHVPADGESAPASIPTGRPRNRIVRSKVRAPPPGFDASA